MDVLLLSGGGSRGAWQAGAWSTLRERFEPKRIVGTSVGAINGAMIAMGGSNEELEHWWSRLRQRDVLKPTLAGALRGHFYSAKPLRKLLETHLDLDSLQSELWVCATDLESGEHVVFKDNLRIEHLMASAALTPGLSPVKITGRWYADGGLTMNPALRPTIEGGAKRMHVLLHSPLESPGGPAKGVKNAIWRNSSLYWAARLQHEVEAIEARQHLPKRHPQHLDKIDMHLHAPNPPLEGDMLRFNPKKQANWYQQGAVQLSSP